MERVLDQDPVNHLLHILQEEVAGLDGNHRKPWPAVTERSSDLVPTRQGRGRIEGSCTASWFTLQEVARPDTQGYQTGTGRDHTDRRRHDVVVCEVRETRRDNQVSSRHDAEAGADTKNPAAIRKTE